MNNNDRADGEQVGLGLDGMGSLFLYLLISYLENLARLMVWLGSGGVLYIAG